jgi:hypothetical protein
MADSGEKPGRLPEPAAAVQIDTTLHRPESRVSHGFQRFAHSFNRTLLTYLFFYVSSQSEAESIASYMETRFFRFLVSLRKITQHATRATYTWVPMQKWNLKWTDERLYKKYGISNDEITFINSMIRPIGDSDE